MSKFHAIYGKGGVSPEPGGDTYGETQVLLWTNSNPNTNFSAQKVALDLSKYDGVIIEYAFSIVKSQVASRIKLEKNISYAHGGGYFDTGAGNARNITKIDDTGVTFTENKDTVTANNVNIPLKIYGYRQYVKETLTSAISGQKILTANTDINIGVGNYALVARGANSTSAISVHKGTLIGYAYDQATTGYYGQGALIKPDEQGNINCAQNAIYQIVTIG